MSSDGSTTSDGSTLYTRIGGAEVISSMIDEFYGRVMNDADLRGFFENSSIERLKNIQKEFFAAALEGPVDYGDADLAHIHQGRGITRRHFRRFVGHLIAILENRSMISRRDAMDIVARIATYADEVTGGTGAEDG